MDRDEYRVLTNRIVSAEKLPVTQREAHKELLDALIRQAARYEFAHHTLALYRIPDETARIVLRHLVHNVTKLIQAVSPEEYSKAQEQIILATQQLLMAGAAMGSVANVIQQLNLFDLVENDPDCPFETKE